MQSQLIKVGDEQWKKLNKKRQEFNQNFPLNHLLTICPPNDMSLGDPDFFNHIYEIGDNIPYTSLPNQILFTMKRADVPKAASAQNYATDSSELIVAQAINGICTIDDLRACITQSVYALEHDSTAQAPQGFQSFKLVQVKSTYINNKV
jgi:hypothetical protein